MIRSDSDEGRRLLALWRGQAAPSPQPPLVAPQAAARAPVSLTVPMLAPSLNGPKGLMRMDHRSYRRVREAWLAAVLAATGHRGDLSPCAVTVVRHYCPHPLDLDNLYASAKVPLDALRHAGLLADDDPSCVVSLSMHQQRVATKKDVRTSILLTPL